jgi:hypothetical protein
MRARLVRHGAPAHVIQAQAECGVDRRGRAVVAQRRVALSSSRSPSALTRCDLPIPWAGPSRHTSHGREIRLSARSQRAPYRTRRGKHRVRALRRQNPLPASSRFLLDNGRTAFAGAGGNLPIAFRCAGRPRSTAVCLHRRGQGAQELRVRRQDRGRGDQSRRSGGRAPPRQPIRRPGPWRRRSRRSNGSPASRPRAATSTAAIAATGVSGATAVLVAGRRRAITPTIKRELRRLGDRCDDRRSRFASKDGCNRQDQRAAQGRAGNKGIQFPKACRLSESVV